MALPAQIVLPSARDVVRPGQPGPAHLPKGAIVIGRVLAAPAAGPPHTPDGRPAIRVQFPQGIVLVPTEDELPSGAQLFAQVREEEGRTLLALLDGVARGSLLRETAGRAAAGGTVTTIDLGGEPTLVETAEPLRAGEEVLAQVQPRGSRAVLRALPAALTRGESVNGRVVSTEGPLLVVRTEGADLLARGPASLAPNAVVTLQVVETPSRPELVATPPGQAPPADSGPSAIAFEAPSRTYPPAVDATLRVLDLPATTVNRTAVADLLAAGFRPPDASQAGAGAISAQSPGGATGPEPPAPVPAPGAPAVAPATPAAPGESTPPPATGPPAQDIPVSAPAPPPAPTSTAAPGALVPAITPQAVAAAAALDAAAVAITPDHVAAAVALLQAEVPVTAASVAAAATFLAQDLPVTAPTISAAVALAEIAVPPQARPVEALSHALFSPSTLSTDLAIVRDVAVQAARENVSPQLQQTFAAVARGLSALVLDLEAGGDQAQQLANATRFGGLQTEHLLGALAEAADRIAPARATTSPADVAQNAAVTRAAQEVARDVRPLLARLEGALREAGDAPPFGEYRAAVRDAAPRVLDRIQGVQLQNLRAPVTQQLTLEVPVRADGRMHTVQLQVYYRQEGGSRPARIDERNTTLALLLETTRLGPVSATVTIADGLLNTDFRVDTQAVADHLMEGAADLRRDLGNLEYTVGRIRAVPRRAPPQPRAPEPEQRIGPDGIDVQV